MRLSTRSRYGARAALEIAREYGQRHVKRREIAEKQEISDSYLENILIALKAQGLVRTVRGAHGGFSLTRSPEKITLLDLFEALEGDLTPVVCTTQEDMCTRSSECVMRGVYQKLQQAQEAVLASYTLQNLVDKMASEPDFAI
jgi:Rrf2 family transcriptional regulator, cysteine metabolism repressor